MARNQAEKGGGIWLKTLLFGGLAMIGIAAAFVILKPMLDAPSSDVVLIKAEPGPFREKPKDPGGTKIPHTDSTVMSMLGGVADSEEDVEILQPPADVPEMPPLPESPDEEIVMAPTPAPAGQAISPEASPENSPEASPEYSVGETARVDAAGTATEATPEATPEATLDQNRATSAAAETEATVSAGTTDANTAGAAPSQSALQSALQAKPQPKPDVPITRKGPAVEGDDPLYLVQLAAFRNADTAREQAAMLGGKHQSRLDGVELGTMKVDAGENGIFWRVITEPLERTDADNLCSALKRAGQDCILRKFDRPSSS
jgi:cell division septation protein DedD